MPKLKLTKRAIERLPAPHPSGRQVLYWDTELRGFGVLVSGTTNAKTYVVQRKLPNGKTRRLTVGPTNVFKLDEARVEAEGKLADLYKGIDPKAARRAGANATLRKTLDDYLEARPDLREKTRADYRWTVERRLAAWLDLPLREITPEMVEARHRGIKEEVERRAAGRQDHGGIRITGNAAANGAMRAFRILWNFAAERMPDLPPNPVRRLRRQWFPVERRERLVRAEELPRFYEAILALPSRTQRDYLLLLLFTGLRRREATSLRWTEVDIAERVIRLPARRTKAGRKLDLPMTDFVRDLLIARRGLGKDGEFVFPSDSKSGHLSEPKFPLGQVAKATGISVSAHDLRRTYVTVAEGTDISPLALKALLNHSLGSDVTSGYVIVTAERLREPAQRVCDRLKKLCNVAPAEAENVEKLQGQVG